MSGTPAAAAAADERYDSQWVTLLFTDLVGSTALLGRLGEGTMEACRRRHFALLRRALRNHEGQEVKNVGDGLMVAFPGARQALDCATAMQAAVAAEEIPGGQCLRMRVGLHTGQTIQDEGDHWGTVVVVARRLCDAAQAQEILTSEAVVDLAGREEGRFRSIGSVALRGLQEPVPAYAVQWAGAPDPDAREREPVAVPRPQALRQNRVDDLVGREPEMKQLLDLWEHTTAGNRSALLVAGEAGIGKTSLVTELADLAHGDRAIVLWGRCDEGLALPFQAFVEALRPLVSATGASRLRASLGGRAPDLGRLLPEVAEELLGGPPRASAEPETDQHLMFEAVSQLLSATSRSAPVLLVLDDLQWADAGTISMLLHLASSSQPARLAIIGTLRDGELDPGHTLQPASSPALERLRLIGLEVRHVRALLEAEAGRPADLALARAVRSQTAGNPFYVTELSRDWSRSGEILGGDGPEIVDRKTSPDLGSSGVAEVIERRMGHLPVDSRRVLTLGSVSGRAFSFDLLERILAADEPGDLAEALRFAVEERMLVTSPDEPGSYAFAHALIRQTRYARVSGARRARLHRQVGEAIEEALGDAQDERLSELAYHFARCAHHGQAPKAIHYALRAGRASLARLAHEAAREHFDHALALLETEPVPAAAALRCEATIGLGEAQLRAGEGAHRETLLDGARQAGELEDFERLARAALTNGRGFFSISGDIDEERVDVLRAALLAYADDDSVVRARLLAQLSMELLYAGDWHGRRSLSDEALAMARRLGDPATLVTVLYQRSAALWGVHGLEERLAAAAEMEPLIERVDDPFLAFQALQHGAHAALGAGDVPSADRRLAGVSEQVAALGQPTTVWFEGVARAKRAIVVGQVEEAKRLAFEAFGVGAAAGQPDALLWCAGQVFAVRFMQGRLDEQTYEGIPALAAMHPRMRLFFDSMLVCCQAAHGCLDEARATLDRQMSNGLEDVPVDFGWIGTVALTGYACWQLGDRRHAERVAELLEPWADHFVDMGPAWLGSTSLFLGLLAMTRGRPLDAHRYFESAGSAHARSNARGFQALGCVAWAELLSRNKLPADAPQAADLAREALEIGHELRLPGVQKRASHLLSR